MLSLGLGRPGTKWSVESVQSPGGVWLLLAVLVPYLGQKSCRISWNQTLVPILVSIIASMIFHRCLRITISLAPPCGLGIMVRYDQLALVGMLPVLKICCTRSTSANQFLGLALSGLGFWQDEGSGYACWSHSLKCLDFIFVGPAALLVLRCLTASVILNSDGMESDMLSGLHGLVLECLGVLGVGRGLEIQWRLTGGLVAMV
jgi:hypothetical protein